MALRGTNYGVLNQETRSVLLVAMWCLMKLTCHSQRFPRGIILRLMRNKILLGLSWSMVLLKIMLKHEEILEAHLGSRKDQTDQVGTQANIDGYLLVRDR